MASNHPLSPLSAGSQASSGGLLAARLRRIDDARHIQQRRRQQHQQPRASVPTESDYIEQQHVMEEQYYESEHRVSDAMSPSSSLSPTSNGSSSRKIMAQRRQNMMARRIEMRKRSEDRQQQVQQKTDEHRFVNQPVPSSSSERGTSNALSNRGGVHQQRKPLHFQQQQTQQMEYPSAGSHQYQLAPSDYSAPQRQQLNGRANAQHQQHMQQQFVVSPTEEQMNVNRLPLPQGGQQEYQQQWQTVEPQYQQIQPHITQYSNNSQASSMVPSPPILQRKQQLQQQQHSRPGEHPSSRLFEGHQRQQQQQQQRNYNLGGEVNNKRNHFREQSITPKNLTRVVSPHESPSDEWHHGEDGHYYNQQHHSRGETGEYFESVDFQYGQRIKNASGQQFRAQQEKGQRQGYQQQRPPIQGKQNQQPQPDWHEVNRQKLYQRKLVSRQQQLHQQTQPKAIVNYQQQHPKQLEQLRQSSSRAMTNRQTNIAAFSPIESLSNRTDRIKQKSKHLETVKPPGLKPLEIVDDLHQFQQQQDEGEESVVSVLDRARNFDANGGHKQQVDQSGRLSLSASRERRQGRVRYEMVDAGETTSPVADIIATHEYPSLLDEDTVNGSVASRKMEWEGKINADQRYHENQQRQSRRSREGAFGVWEERASRLTQLRRSEQRRSVDDKSRRKAVRSLPPERRNRYRHAYNEVAGSVIEEEEYHDGYQSEGPSRETRQPHRKHGHVGNGDQQQYCLDVTPITVQGARRRLWDQNERLRAVMPKSSSFDSFGDVRDRWHDHTYSPGNVSCSAGSGLFKSKFVHAAALASHQRTGDSRYQKQQVPSSKTNFQNGVAVSSHYTDSTAETTAFATSYGSPREHYHQSSQRMVPPQSQQHGSPSTPSYSQSPTEHNDVPPHTSKVSVMPPISERPRSSVSDLIARINAVSRANPAEALAAIDSILKAENKSFTPQKAPRPVPRSLSPLWPNQPLDSEKAATRQPLAKDFFHPQHKEVVQDLADNDGADEDDSMSSDDSTVSSMTNPTYQSVMDPGIRNQLPLKPRPNLVTSRDRQPESNQTRLNTSSDAVVHKASGESRGKPIEATNLNGRQQLLQQISQQPKTVAKNNLDNAWVAIPNNNYFSPDEGRRGVDVARQFFPPINASASSESSRRNNVKVAQQRSRSQPKQRASSPAFPDVTMSAPPPTQYQPRHNAPKRAISPVINEGQTSGLPHAISDAFSGLDISLDEAEPMEDPRSSRSVDPQISLDAVSQAFSGVDINLEQEKTVSQRRQELEYLSKSWNKSSDDENGADYSKPAAPKTKASPNASASNTDWASAPSTKKKAEPKLRLKGSKKLTQRFASLVKAYESDAD